jgi:DEAD/DEAH box helicase domain-containing protein
VANGKPHDLYFFAEPREMIAGRIEPPGVFLNASAVLERQLTAFCFDRWVASGVSPEAIPAKLGQVIGKLEAADPSRFPRNLLRFIENNQTELLEQFLALFADDLDPESKDHIRDFAEGSTPHPNPPPRGERGSDERLRRRFLRKNGATH